MTTLAPSEKHLEDYIWENPECLRLGAFSVDGAQPNDLNLVTRQFSLPSGVLDLFGVYRKSSLVLIELKKGPIDTHALAQLLRYKGDLMEMLWGIAADTDLDNPNAEVLAGDVIDDTFSVQGVLVGSRLSDQNLSITCHACNIALITYTYQDDEYSFDWERPLRDKEWMKKRRTMHQSLDKSDIASAMRKFVVWQQEWRWMAKQSRAVQIATNIVDDAWNKGGES